MPVACIHIPHFALRVALLDRPELDGTPLVLGPPPGSRPVVTDATPEAAARGVRPGLGLREVVALCPDALILPPHPVREAEALTTILAGLEQLSPLVEPDPERPGCCYVDLNGLGRRLGPPATAAAHLLATVPPVLRPRAGCRAWQVRGPRRFRPRWSRWRPRRRRRRRSPLPRAGAGHLAAASALHVTALRAARPAYARRRGGVASRRHPSSLRTNRGLCPAACLGS